MNEKDLIQLHVWRTPNCHKVLILAEELGIPYMIVPVNIREGEQHSQEYERLNPNAKVPTMVVSRDDGAPLVVSESGAILIYLGERSGRFLAAEGPARYAALQWLMFQMSAVGVMCSQMVHFTRLEEKIPYAIQRYSSEVKRLYRLMDQRLGEVEYFAGEYSIADMAMYPWTRGPEHFDLAAEDFPNFQRWLAAMDARPAVQRAMAMSFPPA